MARKKKPALSRTVVDITLPVFGEWQLAEKAILSLERATQGMDGDYKLIVIDNGTPPFQMDEGNKIVEPDIQAEKVKEYLRPRDQFIRLDENIGFPQVQNLAASKGVSEFILIMTADVELFPGAITKMMNDMDDPQVGISSPMLIFPEGSPHGPPGSVQHAGIAFGIQGKPFHIFIGWSPDNPKVNQRREMLAVTGACFLTRRRLFQEIGGFSEVYGGGTFEDMEYSFQVRARNRKIIFNPEARGHHFVGGSIKQGANQAGFNTRVNEMAFKGRNAGMLAWDEWRYW